MEDITHIIIRPGFDSYLKDYEADYSKNYWTYSYYEAMHFPNYNVAKEVADKIGGQVCRVNHEITVIT